MVTVEQVEIYDQNGKMLGVLDNADGIGYELKHNDLWTGSFALPTDDPKTLSVRRTIASDCRMAAATWASTASLAFPAGK